MQQFFIAIILVLGLGSYWLYNENETLKANNLKLEAAVETQKQTMEPQFRCTTRVPSKMDRPSTVLMREVLQSVLPLAQVR